MSALGGIEADKWYWSGGRWVRFSSTRRRWEDQSGRPADPPNLGVINRAAPPPPHTERHNERNESAYRPPGQSNIQEASLHPTSTISQMQKLSLQDPQVHSTVDQKSGIKSTVQTGPGAKVTAAELQQKGLLAHKSFIETRAEAKSRKGKDTFSARYRISSRPHEDFRVGNIIELRWAEPAPGPGATIITRRNDDVGFTRMRRFVIIAEGRQFSAAIPILTYGGRGVTDPGLVRSDHSVIYTGTTPPRRLPGEESPNMRGDNLRSPPIRVEGAHPVNQLDPNSRLNYRPIYQIDQQTCEIYAFGRVHRDSVADLKYNFRLVQRNVRGPPQTANPPHETYDPYSHGPPPGFGGPPAGLSESSPGLSGSQGAYRRVDSAGPMSSGSGPLFPPSARQPTMPIGRPMAGPSSGPSAGPSNTSGSADQKEALRRLARHYQTDLSTLNERQLNDLARRSLSDQTRVILGLLRRQNPPLYARHAAMFRRRHDSERGSGEEDSYDEE